MSDKPRVVLIVGGHHHASMLRDWLESADTRQRLGFLSVEVITRPESLGWLTREYLDDQLGDHVLQGHAIREVNAESGLRDELVGLMRLHVLEEMDRISVRKSTSPDHPGAVRIHKRKKGRS